jgi:hypothetical protein
MIFESPEFIQLYSGCRTCTRLGNMSDVAVLISPTPISPGLLHPGAANEHERKDVPYIAHKLVANESFD